MKKHLVKDLISVSVILGAAMFCLHASAREPLRDLTAFEHWVDEALHCRGDFFEEVQNQKFLDRAKTFGVAASDYSEGDVPEGDFTLPKPILIGGEPATKIHYWGDSGSEVFAIVNAPAETLAKTLHIKPLPERLKKEFDEKTVGANFIGTKSKDERLAPAIFVRQSDSAGVSEVGCRTFDG
jgi:hypothetical protein